MTYEEAYNLGIKRGEERATLDFIVALNKKHNNVLKELTNGSTNYEKMLAKMQVISEIIKDLDYSLYKSDNPYQE